MLKDISSFKDIYIVCGYTDLRLGIEGLAGIITNRYERSVFVPDVLYLFCGRRADRFKGLVWEGDGFILLYKRLASGRFHWPRSADELKSLDVSQLRRLLDGFTIETTIRNVSPTHLI